MQAITMTSAAAGGIYTILQVVTLKWGIMPYSQTDRISAHQLVDEIALEVRPPKGVAIELHERSGSPNWVAGAPPMTVALADKFSAKIAALRKSDPIIDWSAAPSGRVAKFLSEV